MEGEFSNGEDAEAEDVGEDIEVDATVRTEEAGKVNNTSFYALPHIFHVSVRLRVWLTEIVLKTKLAMESLVAIEKCFATLRDKYVPPSNRTSYPFANTHCRLFDEKLAQHDEELAMLNRPNPTHPDFIMLKKVIDKHLEDKIQYERTLLKYKLIALQKKSIAEKAQIHSQYMQSVRDIRERTLEQLQKESYQLQRERRHVEGDVPDYSYLFTTNRAEQIANQTAYNTEVSILSGIAKYVGFPAAPEITGARPNEIEEDLQAMKCQ